MGEVVEAQKRLAAVLEYLNKGRAAL